MGMAPSGRSAAGDGRAHRRTTPGPPYQLPAGTIPVGHVRRRRPAPVPARLGRCRTCSAVDGGRIGPPPGPSGASAPRPRRLLGVVLLAGCGPASVYKSFDPSAPCSTDGRFPGAYPALEARLPATFMGRPPDTIDSGRNCSATELGTLAGHGISEVRFAGASWFLSGNAGITLAMFTGQGLTAEWIGEWYEAVGPGRQQHPGDRPDPADGRRRARPTGSTRSTAIRSRRSSTGRSRAATRSTS